MPTAPLYAALQKHPPKGIFLFGEMQASFANSLSPLGFPLFLSGDLKSAFALALSRAEAGDTLLLSPAATSFDGFADFEERGDFFCRLVKELPEK